MIVRLKLVEAAGYTKRFEDWADSRLLASSWW